MSAYVARFLKSHPDLEFIDLLIPDINGILRGKKINRALASKAFAEGILLPRSLFGTDVCGDTVDATRLGISTGDRDYVCKPEADTLRLVPWADNCGAQAMMEMYDDDDLPFESSPRQLLRNQVQRLHNDDLYPTVAVELEFYLFRRQLDASGRPQLLIDPVTGEPSRSTQVYSMEDLENQSGFIDTVNDYCRVQGIPASAAIAEYAPGQFEINLEHKPDPLRACDDAVLLKRAIRMAARQQGLLATFMAKPMSGLTGSGTHVHVSLCDADGNNRFADDESLLRAAIGGLQATMADAMLLFAPHANSYRRFRKGFYVPLSPSWGHNNRSVALRIPAGPQTARRIEHRVAGADANPYLVMAAVLGGIAEGVVKGLSPDEPVSGNAEEQRSATLPADWLHAIRALQGSEWARQCFGASFTTLLTTIKHAEYESYQRHVPPLDIQWYLQTV